MFFEVMRKRSFLGEVEFFWSSDGKMVSLGSVEAFGDVCVG